MKHKHLAYIILFIIYVILVLSLKYYNFEDNNGLSFIKVLISVAVVGLTLVGIGSICEHFHKNWENPINTNFKIKK